MPAPALRSLAAPYFQPRLRPEAQRVHHLLLTVFWSAPQARRNGGIDGGRLRHFLAQYVAVTASRYLEL